MTMGELSKALLVSGGNLTALVRQLERQGHLQMERDPQDRRSWLVRITRSGRKHFKEMAAEHHHWIAGMFARMSADHRAQLYELLAELKESLAANSRHHPCTRPPQPRRRLRPRSPLIATPRSAPGRPPLRPPLP